MSILSLYWRKICVPLDGFLWHKNIDHPIIRPVLRNMILATGFSILVGAAFYAVFPDVFWFACGILCMGLIFFSWTRIFTRISLDHYGYALLRMVLFSFFTRLVLLAILLYIAMAWFNASAIAIVAGMICGSVLGLLTYTWHSRAHL